MAAGEPLCAPAFLLCHRQTPSTPLPGGGELHADLSPGSLEPAASCVSTDIVCVDDKHSQSLCPSSSGLCPPRANLWEKRDEAEFSAQAL